MRLIETSPGIMGKLSQHPTLLPRAPRALSSLRARGTSVELLAGLALLASSGCARHPSPAATDAPPPAAPSASAQAPAASAAPVASGGPARDGGSPVDAAPGPMIGALFPQTPVMSDMDWPVHEDARHPERKPKEHGAIRIGYIRQGGKVAVVPEAHPKQNCPEGWYELVDGGFVCGRYATLDMNHPRLKLSPHPPYLDQPLPYQYGYNITNGTPLYKSVPSREERVKLEPWLKPRPKVKPPVQREAMGDADAGMTATAVSLPLATAAVPSAAPGDVTAAGGEDAGIPWYLRDFDGGKPQVTLDELREEGGPIARRMVKGFYLALDKELDTGAKHETRWWRSTSGLLAPYERIFVAKPLTDFHGVWLGQEPTQDDLDAQTAVIPDAGFSPTPRPGKKIDFPMAFVLAWHAHKYTLSEDHKKATATDVLRRFTPVGLTGEDASFGGHHYLETTDGWWLRESDGTVARTTAPPKDLGPNEKWIDVNLKTETLVAFVGDKPVFATLVSTGRMDDLVKEKDHRTRPGTFRIREKHVAATMDGDVASDGPYSIEDVPWIMYFNGSIALHGAFWHANFGHVQSHGCVNLAPADARTLFGWTEPQLPTGWHGVEATPDKPGTRVVVHDPPDSHPKWATE